MNILIAMIVLGIIFYSIYYLIYKIPCKHINEEYDDKIKAEPHKKDLFNMLRNLEMNKEEKAKENIKNYLTILMQEELMWERYLRK